METIKFLKLAAILQILFCVICAASLVCVYFGYFYIGLLLFTLWVINPVGPICCVTGLSKWYVERDDENAKPIIGKKWIWFILLFLLTVAVYLISAVLWVEITGGV